MKYENFEKVKKIVRGIELLKHQESVLVDYPVIVINHQENMNVLMTIGVGKTFEHEYSDLASEFVDKLLGRIRYKIHELEIDLDKL